MRTRSKEYYEYKTEDDGLFYEDEPSPESLHNMHHPLVSNNDLIIELIMDLLPSIEDIKNCRLVCRKWNHVGVRNLRRKKNIDKIQPVKIKWVCELVKFNEAFARQPNNIVINTFCFSLSPEESKRTLANHLSVFFEKFSENIRGGIYLEIDVFFPTLKHIIDNYGKTLQSLKLNFSNDKMGRFVKISNKENKPALPYLTSLTVFSEFIGKKELAIITNLLDLSNKLTELKIKPYIQHPNYYIDELIGSKGFSQINSLQLECINEFGFQKLASYITDKKIRLVSLKLIVIWAVHYRLFYDLLVSQKDTLKILHFEARRMLKEGNLQAKLIFPCMPNVTKLKFNLMLIEDFTAILFIETFPKLTNFCLKTDDIFRSDYRRILFTTQTPVSTVEKIKLENDDYQDSFAYVLLQCAKIFPNVKILDIQNCNNYSKENQIFANLWTVWNDSLEEFKINFSTLVNYQHCYLNELERKFTGYSPEYLEKLGRRIERDKNFLKNHHIKKEKYYSILNMSKLKKLQMRLDCPEVIVVREVLTDITGFLTLTRMPTLKELTMDPTFFKFSNKCLKEIKKKIPKVKIQF